MKLVFFLRHRGAFVAAVVLGLLLVGCSGAGKPASSGEEPSSSSRPAAATATPAGSLDLSQAVQKLQALQSFRYDIAFKLTFATPVASATHSAQRNDPSAAVGDFLASMLGSFRSEGAYRAPGDIDVKFVYAGNEIRFVQVGAQAWLNEAGAWRTTDPATIGTTGPSLSSLGAILPREPLGGAKTKTETVNGVHTIRYTFDKVALDRLALARDPSASSATDDATLDVWLTDDGVPVKLLLVASGDDDSGGKATLRLELNLRNLNDASILIKPPV